MRHGQPAWTTEDGRGRNDPPLTNLGQAQAQQMATRLADPAIEPALGPCNRLFVVPGAAGPGDGGADRRRPRSADRHP